MSEFFQDFQEEQKQKKQIKASFDSEEETEELKISNKEKKINELKLEILNLEEEYNNRKVEDLLKKMKNYSVVLKNGIPPFLRKFFLKVLDDPKCSSGLKNKINKFIEKYKKDTNDEFMEVEEKESASHSNKPIKTAIPSAVSAIEQNRFREMLIEINESKNTEEKIKNLRSLIKKTTENENLEKLYFSLLSTLNKEKNINYLEEISQILISLSAMYENLTEKEMFKNNLEFYLSNALELTNTNDSEMFKNLIEKLSFIDYKICKKKFLEFKYFKCNEAVENDDDSYHLLYLVRMDKYDESKAYLTKVNVTDLRILKSFGIMAFYSGDYVLSYEILERCYLGGITEVEDTLLILYVLVGDEVNASVNVINVFCENLRRLEKNPLLLGSKVKRNEIIRAYFFLKKYDFKRSADILNGVEVKLCCHEFLRNKTMKKLCL